jgi:outer membrane protein assembly factor BamA
VLKTPLRAWFPAVGRPRARNSALDTLAIEPVRRRHGFLDAKADARVTQGKSPREAIVTVEVEEGPRSRIGSVTFSGVHAYPADQLHKKLLAGPGRPYNPAFLIADTTRISRAYQDRGYIPHVSASMTRDGLRADVRYDVIEGPLYRFGDVQLIRCPGRVHENPIGASR